jgi:hypothetical protein
LAARWTAKAFFWGGANDTQSWIDQEHSLFALFMVQKQHFRAPTHGAFRALVNVTADIASRRGGMTGPGAGGGISSFQQRDENGDGKLTPAGFPRADLFKPMDQNADGEVTGEEVRGFRPR